MSSKLKSANSNADGHNTMDSFQDGGQNNQAANRGGNFLPNSEGNHINPDTNNFNQMPGNANMANDNYGKMSEGGSGPPGSYQGGYNRGGYGGLSEAAHMNNTGDMSGQFAQYGQQNVRPGFPSQMMRNNTMPGRSGMPNNNMGMMSGNFNSPQRMMNATQPNSMQQQQQQQPGGPTPTLNQLLTNSSTSQRYQGAGYNNYDMSQGKPGHDMSNSGGYNSQSWSGSNPYQQQPTQMQGGQPFRNQVK